MGRKTKPKKEKKPFNPDAQGLFLLALGFLGLLSLLSFSFLDPHRNWLGIVGYVAALGGQYFFGLGALLIPCYFIWIGIRLLSGQKLIHLAYDHAYFLILLSSACILLTVYADSSP